MAEEEYREEEEKGRKRRSRQMTNEVES